MRSRDRHYPQDLHRVSGGDRFSAWLRQQHFGLRLLGFLGLVLLLGFPALVLQLWPLLGNASDKIALAILYVSILAATRWWGKRVRQQAHAFAYWGLTGTRGFYRDLGWGVAIAIATLFGLFAVETLLGWLTWQPVGLMKVISDSVYAVLMGLGVALVEELLFRGWLLRELYEDVPFGWAACVSSAIFALVHAWGVQSLGLMGLGLVLVRARWLRGELGLAIGLHAGWIAGYTTVNTLDWIEYAPAAPEWMTGMGGNPLAGVLGVVLMGLTGMALSGLPARRIGDL